MRTKAVFRKPFLNILRAWLYSHSQISDLGMTLGTVSPKSWRTTRPQASNAPILFWHALSYMSTGLPHGYLPTISLTLAWLGLSSAQAASQYHLPWSLFPSWIPTLWKLHTTHPPKHIHMYIHKHKLTYTHKKYTLSHTYTIIHKYTHSYINTHTYTQWIHTYKQSHIKIPILTQKDTYHAHT